MLVVSWPEGLGYHDLGAWLMMGTQYMLAGSIQEQGPVSYMTKFCPLWPHTGEQLQTAKKETQQLHSYLFTFVEWCFPYINKT